MTKRLSCEASGYAISLPFNCNVVETIERRVAEPFFRNAPKTHHHASRLAIRRSRAVCGATTFTVDGGRKVILGEARKGVREEVSPHCGLAVVQQS